jgi:hypothetical protein
MIPRNAGPTIGSTKPADAPAKPAGAAVKAMNLPAGINTEIRRIIRDEVSKQVNKRGAVKEL